LDDTAADAKLHVDSDEDDDMGDLSNIEEPSPLEQVISKLNRSSLVRKPSKENNSLSRISNSNSTNSSAINSPAPNVIYSPPLLNRAPYNIVPMMVETTSTPSENSKAKEVISNLRRLEK
jgi:hypothetical protein